MDIIIIIIWVNYFRVVNLKSKLISIFLTVDSGVWCCILSMYPVRDLIIKLSSTFLFSFKLFIFVNFNIFCRRVSLTKAHKLVSSDRHNTSSLFLRGFVFGFTLFYAKLFLVN